MFFRIKDYFSRIPKRWIVSAIGFFAFFNSYAQNACLSMAITKMTVPLNNTATSYDETCPNYENETFKNSNTVVGGTFEWSEYMQGIIFSSYYWGFCICQLPGGLLADKYGFKYTIGLGILFSSICSILTSFATFWGDANGLIAIQFVMGLFGGVVQPSISCLLSKWIPIEERGMISSLIYAGILIGIIISKTSSGFILGITENNWPLVFYLFGGLGLLFLVFWIILVYSNPKECPFITDVEKEYLQKKLGDNTHKSTPPFPWKYALTSKPFLALIIMEVSYAWCIFTIALNLPKYMHNVLKLPTKMAGFASSMPNITCWLFSMTMSWSSDWLLNNGYISRTNVRKINSMIVLLGQGPFLVAATYMGCNVIPAISLIIIAATLTGCFLPGIKMNVLDLSPNHAGTLMGIANVFGALSGIFAPYIVGILVPNQTYSEWKMIFWIISCENIVIALVFVNFMSSKVQKWNDPAFIHKEKKIDNIQEDIRTSTLSNMNK